MLAVIARRERETERARLLAGAHLGWQLGQVLGSLQLQTVAALAGVTIDPESFARSYPAFDVYARSLGLLDPEDEPAVRPASA